tara:strand:- start:542 stop:748 length:207 start_codon:yes stop_codon:yes gene_type:complete
MIKLKELSNQELIEMRDSAYEAEVRMQSKRWMHDTKASVSRRSTAVANELCRRLLEGTMELDDDGELK